VIGWTTPSPVIHTDIVTGWAAPTILAECPGTDTLSVLADKVTLRVRWILGADVATGSTIVEICLDIYTPLLARNRTDGERSLAGSTGRIGAILSSAADIPTAPAIVPVGNRVNADAVTAQSAASASARTFLLVLLFLVFVLVLVLVLVVATILLGVRVRGVTRKKSTSHDATQEPAERTTSRAATCSSCEIIESPAIHANLRKMMQKTESVRCRSEPSSLRPYALMEKESIAKNHYALAFTQRR
jgi:hypothetical protein